jgi:hypothetical protein
MIPPVNLNLNDESSHESAMNRDPFRLENHRGITNDGQVAMEKSHDRRKMCPPNRRMHQTEEESEMHTGECRIGRHTPVADCPYTGHLDVGSHRSVFETHDLSLTSCLTSSDQETGESHRQIFASQRTAS